MTRKKTGGMKKGFKYSKTKIWYNNSEKETQIFEGSNIPEGYTKGRLKTNKPAWNKGLNKYNNESMKKASESLKKIKRPSKFTDEYLIKNFLENNKLQDYYSNHGLKQTSIYLHLDIKYIRRCIELYNLESEKDHRERLKKLTYNAEWRLKHSLKLKGKNTWSKGAKHSKEQIEKFKETFSKKSSEDFKKSKYKEYLTRSKNDSYKKHMTKEEKDIKNILLKYFSEEDIKYSYLDNIRYPFNCDFYITSKDLFIEVNAYPSHGQKPFDINNEKDIEKLNIWNQKVNEGKNQYKNWIYTWTDLDVRKQDLARKNKLHYIALYDLKNLTKFEQYLLKLTNIKFSKIESIKKVSVPNTEVYDISVPEYENFILDNNLVVHNCKPYQYFKNAIYEKRFIMYKSDRLFDEFVDIERNMNTGKVDHTPNGHKDVLDAVCGATFTASKHAAEYAYLYGESLESVVDVNEDDMLNYNDYDLLKQEMEQQLLSMHNIFNNNRNSNKNNDLDKGTTDYYMYDDILIM